MVPSAQNCPPVPPCTRNWCEVVQAPSGWLAYTNVVLSPESPMCLGGYVEAWPDEDGRCSQTITVTVSSPPGTNCPPVYATNSCQWPYFKTNWWVVNHPGYSGSGEGPFVWFYPTHCGEGTITFYGIWRNWNPCTGEDIGGGTISRSTNFTVVNVDIAETERTVCAGGTTSFTLTNTCRAVTWELDPPAGPGDPQISGGAVSAGTNGGIWTVTARSTINTNCYDSATLNVIKVTLTGVTFSGTNYHAVLMDTNGVEYPTPHWTNNYGAPVCFTRNTHMDVLAEFEVEPWYWWEELVVRGDSSGPKLPAGTNWAWWGTLTVWLTSTNPFGNQVDFLNPMTINWQYSPDYGTNWCTAGTSTNPVYVTLADPTTANMFHTVVHLACAYPGAATDAQALTNTWAFFEGPGNVATWDGRSLHYYRQGFASCPTRLPQLLATDDGNCNAWAELLHAALQANGIEAARTTVRSDPEFGVKNLSFVEPPTFSTNYAPYNYSRPLTTPTGIPGQNTATPAEKLFGVHWIVHPNVTGAIYYDPSYGVTAADAATYTSGAINAWRANDPYLDRWAKHADDSTRTLSFSDGAWP